MSINLPPIIQKYIDASNAHDVKSILPCFNDEAAIRIQRIRTVDRKGDAGVGALGGLRFFVHGDAIAMEMTSPFRLQKGRRSGL